MRIFTLVFLCLFFWSNSYSCHLSGISLTGSGVVDNMDGTYTIDINLCIAYGNNATSDTYDIQFNFSGGTFTSINSYPAVIGDEATWGNTADGTLNADGTAVDYDSGIIASGGGAGGPQPLADLNGNGQICAVYTFVTNGLPAQIDLFGVESTTTDTGAFTGSFDYCNYYYTPTDDTPESIIIDPNDLSLGGTTAPLPVEFKSLKVFFNEGEDFNTIEWETYSEINNDFFDVQVSSNGFDYRSIGKVQGNGNSTELKKYKFIDRNPGNVSYYRIMQTDFDGSTGYSTIFPLIRNLVELSQEFQISPNPANSFLNIDAHESVVRGMEAEIYNISGVLVKSNFMNSFLNEHLDNTVNVNDHHSTNNPSPTIKRIVDISDLKQGTYFIVFRKGNEVLHEKFIKL